MYCARCNGVFDVRHWKVELGCVRVFNDNCTYPVLVSGADILRITVAKLKANPTLEEVKDM